MSNNKLVSIIIPCYNSEHSIRQCIESVQNQSYTAIQIIVIDDGSSDNTLHICRKMAKNDNRIEVYHQSNSGVSIARNRGLDVAKGEYVVFVDSDDYIHHEALEQILSSTPMADLTFYSCFFTFPNGDIKSYTLHDFYVDNIQKSHEEIIAVKSYFEDIEYFGYTWNKLLLNSIIQKHHLRFIPNLSYREDEIFTLEYYLYSNSLRTCSIPLYNYIVQQNSLTTSQANSGQFLLYLEHIIPLIKKLPYSDLYRYEIQRIFYLCIYAAKLARREKKFKNHQNLVRKAYEIYKKVIKPHRISIRKVYCHSSWPMFYLNILLHYRR